MSDRYDLLLVIGRFQPFCDAHRHAIASVASLADRVRVVVVGDDMPRSARYPFTMTERLAIIRAEGFDAVAVPEVLTAGERMAQLEGLSDGRLTALFVFDGDYRDVSVSKLYPVPDIEVASDAIRTAWLEGQAFGEVSDTTRGIMADVAADPAFPALREEHAYIRQYKQEWAAAPYPPVMVTVDTFIRHDGKVLLVKRGGLPGRGQWALPGGFLDQDETLFEAALRELHEETGLRLTPEEGRTYLTGQRVFDQPQRSARGRTITHAFAFDLSGLDLPELIAGDDAAAAKWTGIDCARNMRKHMFEDHYLILDYFLNKA
ncbi:NUDIX domain-containing protein [Asticcacaulis sp. BYS171W]|uniref:NUDIX domain-containing protein n=1 Tax=Asticcacaulis aquaticus TaxID=2984212 RepID=A0ABT5HS64_9CAUL|nr:NUDIX domain-containing protein [Asticcacaulis aquaticus]MDC7682894.1 NUDIX domain-containing protein [Asticcacaulis aquaticus]